LKQFKDSQGREWTIDVTIGQIKRVRDLVKVNLYALFQEEAKRLFSDPVLLVDTLYVLCQQQAEARKMSDEDFGRIFEGDVLEAAANALLEAVLDFFPSSRRTILRATVDKSNELASQAMTKAAQKIASLTLTDLLPHTASPG
jgi:hypothetical protein